MEKVNRSMKIGTKAWFKRERDWLVSDIEFTLRLVKQLQGDNAPAEFVQQEKSVLTRLRRDLKLLRDNPSAYERKTKKILS